LCLLDFIYYIKNRFNLEDFEALNTQIGGKQPFIVMETDEDSWSINGTSEIIGGSFDFYHSNSSSAWLLHETSLFDMDSLGHFFDEIEGSEDSLSDADLDPLSLDGVILSPTIIKKMINECNEDELTLQKRLISNLFIWQRYSTEIVALAQEAYEVLQDAIKNEDEEEDDDDEDEDDDNEDYSHPEIAFLEKKYRNIKTDPLYNHLIKK